MTYSSISITAPDSAVQGDVITVVGNVTNVTASPLLFRTKIYAVRDIYAVPDPSELLETFEQTIEGGVTKKYAGVFTMPAWDTIVVVMVYRFIEAWDFDNYATKIVSLPEVPGIHTEITSLSVPQSARAGDNVTISVGVKNLYSGGNITVTVTGTMGAVPIYFGNIRQVIAPGEIATFTQGFTMPNADVAIKVWSHYLTVDQTWFQDDSASTTVSITEEPPEEEITGIITKTEIEVNGVQMAPPVPGVEVGEEFKLYVWGLNTSSETLRMALRYVITKPSGVVIDRRYDELWPYTGAGNDHRFVEGKFDVDEPGTWLLQLHLYGDDILIDMADMELFTVAGAPPDDPTIMLGEIVSVELEVRVGVLARDILQLPAAVQVGTDFWIRVVALNKTSETLRLGMRFTLTKPDGSTISDEMMELWPYTGGDKLHEFSEPAQELTIDQSGEWNLKVELLGGETKQVLDTWEGLMLTTGELPSGFTLIRDHTYALASTYYGQAERSTVTFAVVAPSFMLSDDKIAELVTSLEDKFAEVGAHMLELKLYEKSGLVKSEYSADVVTTIPTAATSDQTVPTIFGISTTVFIAIIIAVCLIVGLIIILVVRKEVSQFLFGTPPTNGEPGVPGVMDLIGNMVVIMMMVMMMETMGPMLAPEGAPPRPKPVTEAVVKAAKVAGKAVVKAAPVVGKAVVKAVPYVGKAAEEAAELFKKRGED